MLVDLGEHLDRSQMMLVELVSADDRESVDISGERARAEQLVSANRLYRQTAMATGDAGIVRSARRARARARGSRRQSRNGVSRAAERSAAPHRSAQPAVQSASGICRCPAATEIHRAKRERDPRSRSRPAEERSHEEDILDSVRRRRWRRHRRPPRRGAGRSTPCRCRRADAGGRRTVGRTQTGGWPGAGAASAHRADAGRPAVRRADGNRADVRPANAGDAADAAVAAMAPMASMPAMLPMPSMAPMAMGSRRGAGPRGRAPGPRARSERSVRCSARSRSAIASHRSTSRATARCMKGAGIAP